MTASCNMTGSVTTAVVYHLWQDDFVMFKTKYVLGDTSKLVINPPTERN